MEEQGVNLLDMGPVLDQLGKPKEYYSLADYHYQFEGAYVTYRAILEELNRDLGLDLTVLDGDSLTVETLPNPYLGSRGEKFSGWRTAGSI